MRCPNLFAAVKNVEIIRFENFIISQQGDNSKEHIFNHFIHKVKTSAGRNACRNTINCILLDCTDPSILEIIYVKYCRPMYEVSDGHMDHIYLCIYYLTVTHSTVVHIAYATIVSSDGQQYPVTFLPMRVYHIL